MANKTTKDAGLHFNVNTVRADMVEHFKTHELFCEATNKDGETSMRPPMFSGSPVAATATIERMCQIIMKNALKNVVKDNSGLRTVTRPLLRQSVALNAELHEYFNWRWRAFNKKQMYSGQVPVSLKEFTSVIDKINGQIKLTPKAQNLMFFLLSEIYVDIIHTAFEFISFAGKRTLNKDAVVAAVRNRFPDNIAHEVVTEINRATADAGEDDGRSDGDDEDHDKGAEESGSNDDSDNNDDEGGSDEEAPKQTTRKGKGKAAKKATKAAQIEEDDEEVHSDGGEDGGSDEEAEEAKPAPKRKAAAKGGAKKGKTTRRAGK